MIRHTSQTTIDEAKYPERQRQMEDSAGVPQIRWDPGLVALNDRIRKQGHKPLCVWLTGVSGAGKSAIAHQVEKQLFDQGMQVVRLDSETLLSGLNRDLAFGRRDQKESIRRTAHLARILHDFGHVVLCTFVSPNRADRQFVRSLFPEDSFVEVHVDVSMSEARRRDPHALYQRSQAGETLDVAGVDLPYEAPDSPELRLDSESGDPATTAEPLLELIRSRIKKDAAETS